MAEYREQEQELVFALDIGTRSIVGVVGRAQGDRFQVLDIETAEHGKRVMMDGQIDNIAQVGRLAREVTDRLEQRLNVRLSRVCVAAAGRALRTQSGSFSIELPADKAVDAEQISRLEAGAVSAAEEGLQLGEEERHQFFLVGYTVAQYRLDNYPLTSLLQHTGRRAEVDVVATFLPGEVVESLYAAMRAAGLQVASMTLEPIAAMNAAIPAELRLLNLALVDIGAGTTDIAVCREGSVVGYTMATVAGDEITEAIMKTFLVDFSTAEGMKRALASGEPVAYRDILGLESLADGEQIRAAIQLPMERLAQAIGAQVREVNGGPPSALFLAGGGSRLSGLREAVARSLEMDERRVAIAGSNFEKSVWSEQFPLDNPEYTTPLGIAVSAGLGLLHDSYMILLNDAPAKLFRSGVLTLRDILLMNGYSYADMVGRSGRNLNVTVDGRHVVLRGEPSTPAILTVNGADAAIHAVIHAGDRIHFTPARSGADASATLGSLLGEGYEGGRVLLNNHLADWDTPLKQGDVVLTLGRETTSAVTVQPVPPVAPSMEQHPVQPVLPAPAMQPAPPVASAPAIQPAPPVAPAPAVQPMPSETAIPVKIRRPGRIQILLNGSPMTLPGKDNALPYYLMDLLEHSGLDFDNISRPVRLTVNGVECGFQQELRDGDQVFITCD